MRKSIVFATFVSITAGAAGASALNDVALLGSDTLYDVTNAVLAGCSAAAGTTYLGTGSSNGENAMVAGTQTIAPMSRALKSSAACQVNNGTTAEQLAFARDGISIVVADSTGGQCHDTSDTDCLAEASDNGLAYNTLVTYGSGSSYRFADWKDVLKIVYSGISSLSTTRDCNSAVRQAVVNNYGNLFQQQSCANGSCTQLRHAYRRDGSSGTTDTFLSVLGVSNTTTSPGFCNVLTAADAATVAATVANVYEDDFQNQDLIRRECAGDNDAGTITNLDPTEQVCGKDGTLGLVLPVYPVDYLSSAEAFPTTPCTTRMMLGKAPADPYAGTASGYGDCPNEDSTLFIDKCLIPVDASGNANCFASATTRPLFVFRTAAASADGRVYNLHLREPGTTGEYLMDIKATPRQIKGAFYRIHSTRTMSAVNNTVGTCQNLDATSQIGCLVAASPCSIGFAGNSAADYTGAGATKLGGIGPDNACIVNATYPLSRYLYVNSLVGFGGVTGDEQALAGCFASNGSALAAANGFTSITADCVDFDDTQCGNASNTNACADNTAPIPQ